MSLRNRAGFAIPMALLVMVVLTVGITAGFKSTSAEIVSNAAHRGDNKAYFLAQAGIEKFMATRNLTGLCATPTATTTDTVRSTTTTAGLKTQIVGCLADPAASNADSEWVTIKLTK